jgi:hypothetical protein
MKKKDLHAGIESLDAVIAQQKNRIVRLFAENERLEDQIQVYRQLLLDALRRSD